MDKKNLYFKSDFTLFETCEAGYAVPFKFAFFTNSRRLAYECSYDGTNYKNCELMADGRLKICFDDHHLGIGPLRVERQYFLTNDSFRTGICDEFINPTLVVAKDDNNNQFNIILSLNGDRSISANVSVPAYYQKGDKGDKGDTGPQGPAVDVVDNLTSDDTTKALSAKQGKVLNDNFENYVKRDTSEFPDGVDINVNSDYYARLILGEDCGSGGAAVYMETNGTIELESVLDINLISNRAIRLNAEEIYINDDEIHQIRTDIADNLTTDDSTKALSAKQGKVLNDTKQNSLTTAQMSAVNSGITSADKTKLDSIPANANHTDIVDNITSDDSTKALSAKQGKVLSDMISQHSSVEIVDNLTSTDATKALSAKQGKVLSDMISQSSSVEVVDNLTTEDSTKALSAKQGKVLNTNMSNIARDLGQISDLQTTEKTSAVAAINELHNNIGDVETILSTING